MRQEQFLNVINVDEAHRRLNAEVPLEQLDPEWVGIDSILGRTSAEDIVSAVNVPSFDRSNFDGFAVRADDTRGADESRPVTLTLAGPTMTAGTTNERGIQRGEAIGIATGGMIPRGADSIVMIEHAEAGEQKVRIFRSSAAGFGVSHTGSDISVGQTVLFAGTELTSRETGILAAIGLTQVSVRSRPRVAVISTGNEIIAPGEMMKPGLVFDSNSRIICDAAIESGADAFELGIANDDLDSLRDLVQQAVSSSDLVILSGGTSKGPDDLSFQVVSEFSDPGIVVHGVAVKPGKPICLAATRGKPVVVLPGFPTSAIFMFHEFVKPLIRKLAGRGEEKSGVVVARLAARVNSAPGRMEFNLVRIANRISKEDPTSDSTITTAFPMGQGSGSVTTFSQADGFFCIDRNTEFVEAGREVEVQLISRKLPLPDLVISGSHCIGLDLLAGILHRDGFVVKQIPVGSTAGIDFARRGWCDLAGIHLLDPESGRYNQLESNDSVEIIPGYTRQQGVVVSPMGPLGKLPDADLLARVASDESLMMINRNAGSGTRILIECLLKGARPRGYPNAVTNHHAVAAAVEQGRADWGLCTSAAAGSNLRFVYLADEHFDFAVPRTQMQIPAVVAFTDLLASVSIRKQLSQLGCNIGSDSESS